MKCSCIILFFLPLLIFADPSCEYDEKQRLLYLELAELGSIYYHYNDTHLLQVVRLSPSNEVLYTHSYNYDSNGNLISENLIGDLGEIIYEKDIENQKIVTKSPFSLEICEYDQRGNLTRHTKDDQIFEYSYTAANELISSDSNAFIEHDEQGRVIHKSSPKGNFLFTFDSDNRLVDIRSEYCYTKFIYDSFGRRLSKTKKYSDYETTETYLYHKKNELAIFESDGTLRQLRIPGLSIHQDIIKPIAIETPSAIYAPIHDIQGNITKLIDITSKETICLPSCNPFGEGLDESTFIPWVFAGKHYDFEIGLVDFGMRFYDPELRKWITPDPLGSLQSQDLYQYCFNNPFSYFDPDGQFVIAIPLIWSAAVLGEALLDAALIAGVSWLGYETIKQGDKWIDNNEQEHQRLEKKKDGKQKDGTPKSNEAQNDQFDGAIKEIERKIGKKLKKKQRRQLHDEISKKNYNYHEIVEEGYWMFHD